MTKSVAETTIAIANNILDVQRALDAFTYKRQVFLSCTVEKTMREIEQAFGNERYAEAEHLIDIIHVLIAREAQQFKKDPKNFIEKYQMIRETALAHSYE